MRFDFRKTSKEVFEVMLRDVSSYGGIGAYCVAILLFTVLNDFLFASRLVLSLLAVTAIVAAIRLAIFKPRPGMKKKPYQTYYERIDNSAFPSIHAARSALLSIAFYTLLPTLATVLIILTLMVCMGRLYFRRHDIIDISAGLLIGIILGVLFFAIYS